jgi:CubicO group peptidase (beta-lactamase class C family)
MRLSAAPYTIICISILGVIIGTGATQAAHLAGTSTDRERSQRLDQLMLTEVTQHHFSGAVLVARDGHILLEKGYGFANVEWAIPNSPTTKYRIASLTKQFTATVVMQLRNRGQLNLQDSICKYLQPCAKAWQPVTLHHLLSHTSGIPGYGPAPDPKIRAMPPWTAEQLAQTFRDKPLEFPPGTQSKYSDWGYSLLGLVIEKVTGKSYEAVLREQIFVPLGMHDSGYDHTEITLKNRAAGYRLEAGQLQNAAYIDMAGPYAAGGLYSTVEDLYKWDQALYTDSILPQASRGLMWTEVLAHYGYGWIVVPPLPESKSPPWAVPGHFQIVAPGSINGFSAEILRFPNDRTTVIVLANLQDAHTVGSALGAIALGQ